MNNEKITIKLFVGCLLTNELKNHLNQSESWKQARIPDTKMLIEIRHHEKDYLGYAFSSPEITLPLIRKTQKCLLEELERHCPEFNFKKASLFIFPQVFLS